MLVGWLVLVVSALITIADWQESGADKILPSHLFIISTKFIFISVKSFVYFMIVGTKSNFAWYLNILQLYLRSMQKFIVDCYYSAKLRIQAG